MRVLIISGEDLAGGGHRAAFRLHQALRGIGVESFMAVRRKHSTDPHVHQMTSSELGWPPVGRGYMDLLPSVLCRRKDEPISLGLQSANLAKLTDRFKPDVVNLHWVNGGIAGIRAVGALQVPFVWTLHDMWTFTGGCHYDDGCGRYTSRCGACPHLGSTRTHDLSRLLWQLRRWAVARRPITYVCPSHWLATCARASALLQQARIEEIPYGLDTMLFQPMSRLAARQALNLPSDRRIILFGAMDATKDTRKGYQFLLPALQQLPQHTQQPWLGVTFGGAATNPPDQAIPMQHLGLVTDDHRMRQVYAAADVFVAPSVQDNLPNTILEALSCGTPCVAFAIGGMPDMIEHQANGYLALPFDVSSLAAGIAWTVTDETRMAQLSAAARHTVESRYTLTRQAQRYHALYQDILSQSSSAI